MNEVEFNKAIDSIKLLKHECISFEEYQGYITLIQDKIRNSAVLKKRYPKLYEMSIQCCLIWGLLSFSLSNLEEKNTDVGRLIHALSSQISNGILAIINLCADSLDYSCGVLLRSTFEITLTLTVLLIDQEKIPKYINSEEKDEMKIWSEEFRFKILNQTIANYEKGIFLEDETTVLELKKWRQDIYQKYSKYIHNDYLSCMVNAYTNPTKKHPHHTFNLWGEYNTRSKKYLYDVCLISFISTLSIFSLLSDVNYESLLPEHEFYKQLAFKAKDFFYIFKHEFMKMEIAEAKKKNT